MTVHFSSIFQKVFTLICFSICLLFSLNTLSGSQFDSKFNHSSVGEIKRIKVCGERCSGTNFLVELLHANFPTLERTGMFDFGHKHFLWWFGTPVDYEKLKKLKCAANSVDMSGSEDCLFVVVIRDPYDWLRSFYLMPWSAHEDFQACSFSHFLKTEWKLSDLWHVKLPTEGQYGEIDNCNPWTGQPFRNVIQMREGKIENYLTLGKLVDNYLLVNYEDVSENPEKFINFVSTYFKLVNKKFVPLNTYKETKAPYVKKQYFPIPKNDLKFINSQLDWRVENKVGYFKKDKFEIDPSKPFSVKR
jgi:hypothetical protein